MLSLRQTRLLWRTLREDDGKGRADTEGARLLLRAGLAQRVGPGRFLLTPMGLRALRRVEGVITSALVERGAQEVRAPADDEDAGSGRAAALEALARAATKPEDLLLLTWAWQGREEARPRGGLLRAREARVAEARGLCAEEGGMDRTCQSLLAAVDLLLAHLDLDEQVFALGTRSWSGRWSTAYGMPHAVGDDEVAACAACGWQARRPVAARPARDGMGGPAEPLRIVETPGATTIAALVEQLGCRSCDTLKAVYFDQAGTTVMALVLGDRQVAQEKLELLLGTRLAPLFADAAARRGLVPGFAGPVALEVEGPLLVVADWEVTTAAALVCGANRPDAHVVGARPGTDFAWRLAGDIALIEAGEPCPQCGAPVTRRPWLRMGAVRAEGPHEAPLGGAPLWTSCAVLDATRLLGAVLEVHHDGAGIVWPESAAPYAVHVLALGDDEEVLRVVERLERVRAGDVLVDDRAEPAGVKFHDADLLGLPWRITVGRRALAQGGVDLLRRRDGEARTVPLADVESVLSDLLLRRGRPLD